MRIGRREFLECAAAGVGSILAGCGAAATGQGKAVSTAPGRPAGASGFFEPGEAVELGRTGIKLSRVGLGTGMRGSMRQSNQTRLGSKGFSALIRAAFDRGIRWYDMADLYGSHTMMPDALKGIARDKYVLVSKIWWRRGGVPEFERPGAEAVVARFLKELQTDYIDVVQLHCVSSRDWVKELDRYLGPLDKLKQKGAIRAHGVSCHSLDALIAAADSTWADTVHARINPFGLVMDGPTEQVAPVLKRLHDAGKGVIGMKIIGEGKIGSDGPKKDESIRYALTLGCIDTMVVGCESIAEIDDVVARVRKVPRAAGTA